MIRIGQKFHRERLKRGLSVDDVAKATKIRPSFISAIERGEYHKIPSPNYAKGFVRNYAEFLGLSPKETLALFRREYDVEKQIKVLPETYTKPATIPARRTKIRYTVFAVVGMLLLIAGFLLYQYRSAFFSPMLTVETPKEAVVTTTEVVVTGRSEPSATVVVNNTPVALDPDGNFRKTITVFPGKAVITVVSTNRLGKRSVVEKEIEVRE